ncbi:MAG: glycosyltransferase family 2 protein [Christensenellales bacterium]|jgi:glycosyltransferase involved in cell wall biosynthesis
MDKVLSIIVPAYNADWCIEKCLFSFIEESILESLEVIVVNDGSTDRTSEIAQRFVNKYPNTFRLINKENGGHGSGINAAVKIATGKYFKVIDADDWVITENLAPFLEDIRDKNADVILTHFHTIDMITGRRQAFITKGITFGNVYTINDFAKGSNNVFRCATFHGITYNTKFYRYTGISLPEKVFYEDQEYATLPFSKVKTVLPIDLFLYQYLIGNCVQSVSDENQVRHIKDIKSVVLKIADAYNDNPDMPKGAKKYFIYKFSDILKSYYVVALIKDPNRKAGRQDVIRFRDELAEKNRMLVLNTNKDYNIVLLMHYLRITSKNLQRLKQSVFFKCIYATASILGARKHEKK